LQTNYLGAMWLSSTPGRLVAF